MQETKEITIQDVIAKRKQHTRRIDSKLITFFEPMEMEIVKGDISQILKENV